jgi:hypothetical protein
MNPTLNKISDHMLVVNYLMEDVHRGAVPLECSLYGLDRHFNTRTVSTWLSYDDVSYCHGYASSLED